MLLKFLSVLSFCLLINIPSIACSCGTDTPFCTYLASATTVFEGRLLPSSSTCNYADFVVTDSIRNYPQNDTFRVWFDPGFLCYSTAPYAIGDTFILILQRIQGWPVNPTTCVVDTSADYAVVAYCGEDVLHLKGNKYHGNINSARNQMLKSNLLSDSICKLGCYNGIQTLSNAYYHCIGDTLTLEVNVPGKYLWYNGDTSNTINVILSHGSSHWVQITDTSGCMYYDTLYPKLFQPLQLYSSGDTVFSNLGYNPIYWIVNGQTIVTTASYIVVAPPKTVQAYYTLGSCTSKISAVFNHLAASIQTNWYESVSVYPTLINDKIVVESETQLSWQLIDIGGKVIARGKNTPTEKYLIDASNFSKGMYLLTIEVNGVKHAVKLIK